MPLFSCWLRPCEDDENYLREIINALGKKYSAQLFTPHLTIYGSVQLELNSLIKIVRESILQIPPFLVTINRVNFSEQFFKTVFIEFQQNVSLSTIYNHLHNSLHKFGSYKLNPHISLIYKDLDQKDKEEMIKNIYIRKTGFTIDRISIVSPGENNQDWYNIPQWKIVHTETLSK